MFYAISTLVLVIISIGLYFRSNKKIHVPLMLAAFIIDLSLVLVIEIQRHAVENVIGQTSLFVWFHAFISLFVLFLYVALAITGSKMAKLSTGSMVVNYTVIHRNLAISFVVLRLINYFTSFYMPGL